MIGSVQSGNFLYIQPISIFTAAAAAASIVSKSRTDFHIIHIYIYFNIKAVCAVRGG
jgi:hypothetical protein